MFPSNINNQIIYPPNYYILPLPMKEFSFVLNLPVTHVPKRFQKYIA